MVVQDVSGWTKDRGLMTEVKKLAEVDKKKWDDFNCKSRENLLYTSFNYLKMLEHFLKSEVYVISVLENGEWIGGLPVVLKSNERYGSVCNSLPFYGSNGSMIINTSIDSKKEAEVRRRLLDSFYKFTRGHKCISYTIITNPLNEADNIWIKENLKHNCTDERIGQITHLPSMQEEDKASVLMKLFEDPRPRNIRKAIKEKVKVHRLNNTEAIDFLYKTHYENITAINGIPKEKLFFELIPSFFSDNDFKIYVAELNGQWIAGLLLFYYNETVEYFTPAVVEEFRNIQPSALLIYEAMLDAINAGYKNWNWGGTWLSQGGVYDFKKRWGTTDHRYFYYTEIIDDKVYSLSREILLREYPYFFVIPFNKLKANEN